LIKLAKLTPATVIKGSWVVFAILLGMAGACAITIARPTWAGIQHEILQFANNRVFAWNGVWSVITSIVIIAAALAFYVFTGHHH
jgi:hypothetical protein